MVVFHGKVLAGRTAVKTDTTELDTFEAPHAVPLGSVNQGRVEYLRQDKVASEFTPLHPAALSARIAVVSMVVGDDGRILDLARAGHDGVVVVAFGSGNVPPGAVPAIGRWVAEGKPVVLASRCPRGVVSPIYAFEGGGARLVGMGAIPAGPRAVSQACMELMISLSAGRAYGS
jgi:L-asparaginase